MRPKFELPPRPDPQRPVRESPDMRVIGPSSAEELVAEFLRGELHSPSWRAKVTEAMLQAGLVPDQVEQPDLTDYIENRRRAAALGGYRGWPYRALFAGWPQRVTWQRTALAWDDLARVLYANCDPWIGLSGGSLRVSDAVQCLRENVRLAPEETKAAQRIAEVVETIRMGQSSRPLMLVLGPEDGHPIVLVEGHTRMTAYLVAGAPDDLEVIYAVAPLAAVRGWQWFRKESLGV